jgi:Ino eighty subunit 1
MENVNYILDRGLREAHVKAKKRRAKDNSSVARAWKRCRALPDMYDSEEEAAQQHSAAQVEAMAAARALVMLSSLQPGAWEQNDWGEEATNLASGMRKVRRRTERWETGAQVVRKREVLAAGVGGEDVPLPGRQEEMYEDGEDLMDVDGVERSSLPDVDREEEDEDEEDGYEGEYANGHAHGVGRRGIMV